MSEVLSEILPGYQMVDESHCTQQHVDKHRIYDLFAGDHGLEDELRDAIHTDVQHDVDYFPELVMVSTPCTVSAGPSEGVSSPLPLSAPIDHTLIHVSVSASVVVDTTHAALVAIQPASSHTVKTRDIIPFRFLRSLYIDLNEKGALKKMVRLHKIKYEEFL